MTDQTLRSVKVSGSAVVAGGQYDEVRGSGSVRIDGALSARYFHVSGSTKGHGAIEVAVCETSGSLHVDGRLLVGELRASGSVKISGDVEIRSRGTTSGSLTVGGALRGQSGKGTGSLKVGREVALEQLSWAGAITCTGLVSADVVELRVGGESRIGELAGSSIQVSPGGWRIGRHPRLIVGEVSGDDVSLENTEAKLVRGDRVTIGPRCRVERLEYREHLQVDQDATVGETIHLEAQR